MGRSRELALTFEASERIVSSAEATGGREQFSPLAHTPQPPTTPGRVKVALREDVGPGSNRLEAERMLRWPGGCCRRFLPRQTVPGLWPNGCCDPVAATEFQGPPEAEAALPRQEPPSRGRSWAEAALPRQELGRRPPSRGRSRAAAAAATAGRAQLPQRFPGQRPPEPSVSRERLLPFGGAVPAIRAGGCHENAGQLPPREGGCCAATEAVAARQQDSIRLGRPVAAH